MWLVVAIIAALIVVGLLVYGVVSTQPNVEIPVMPIDVADTVTTVIP